MSGENKFRKILREQLLKEAKPNEELMNAILDKISEKGVNSLTPNEKQYLQQYNQGDIDNEVERKAKEDIETEDKGGYDLPGVVEVAAKAADKSYNENIEKVVDLADDTEISVKMEDKLNGAVMSRIDQAFKNIKTHKKLYRPGSEFESEGKPVATTVFATDKGVYELYVNPFAYQTQDRDVVKDVDISKDDIALMKLDDDPDNLENYVRVKNR